MPMPSPDDPSPVPFIDNSNEERPHRRVSSAWNSQHWQSLLSGNSADVVTATSPVAGSSSGPTGFSADSQQQQQQSQQPQSTQAQHRRINSSQPRQPAIAEEPSQNVKAGGARAADSSYIGSRQQLQQPVAASRQIVIPVAVAPPQGTLQQQYINPRYMASPLPSAAPVSIFGGPVTSTTNSSVPTASSGHSRMAEGSYIGSRLGGIAEAQQQAVTQHAHKASLSTTGVLGLRQQQLQLQQQQLQLQQSSSQQGAPSPLSMRFSPSHGVPPTGGSFYKVKIQQETYIAKHHVLMY
jgi:hypothetical protein